MGVEKKDIDSFVRVAKEAAPIDFVPIVYETGVSEAVGRLMKEQAESLALTHNQGRLNDGENLDARLTAIKTNLSTGDVGSAVVGMVGTLEERVGQLRVKKAVYGADSQLIFILEHLGASKLSGTSTFKRLFDNYQALLYL